MLLLTWLKCGAKKCNVKKGPERPLKRLGAVCHYESKEKRRWEFNCIYLHCLFNFKNQGVKRRNVLQTIDLTSESRGNPESWHLLPTSYFVYSREKHCISTRAQGSDVFFLCCGLILMSNKLFSHTIKSGSWITHCQAGFKMFTWKKKLGTTDGTTVENECLKFILQLTLVGRLVQIIQAEIWTDMLCADMSMSFILRPIRFDLLTLYVF